MSPAAELRARREQVVDGDAGARDGREAETLAAVGDAMLVVRADPEKP